MRYVTNVFYCESVQVMSFKWIKEEIVAKVKIHTEETVIACEMAQKGNGHEINCQHLTTWVYTHENILLKNIWSGRYNVYMCSQNKTIVEVSQ